jgi:RimJ/RimL family protein N-acetyltransferase
MTKAHVDALTEAATADRSTFSLAPVPRDRAEMERYVDRALAEHASFKSVPFVVEHAGKIVGSYRLMSLEWWTWPDGPIVVEGEPRHPGSNPPDVAEIGHAWITPAAQRTAVNSSVCYLLMKHAFEEWKVHRLVLKTDARNERSRNAIQRLGGKLEGILRSHTPAADGIIRDVAMFSILPSEWQELRERLRAGLESARGGTHNP